MITCENLVLTILDLNQYVISWALVGDVNNDSLIIQRSEVPDSNFEDIGTVDDDITTFTDIDPISHQKYIPFYYRIQNPDGTFSETVHLPSSPDKYLLQQNRMLMRYLQRDVGVKSYYFHYKKRGIKCGCWDEQLRKSVINDCKDCAGTGRLEGYDDPIILYISYPQDTPTVINVGPTKFQIANPQAWTGNAPLVYPEDIIIRDHDREVFKVGNTVGRTGRKMYPSRQFLPLRAIERGAVEFDLIQRITA